MTSTEVQRTLVKSPPELWAELSDPDALTRLLAELGEIRITAVEPEHAIRWEAPDATGSVEINPSAWGTKVTLSVTRKASEIQPVEPQAAQPVEPEAAQVDEPQAVRVVEPATAAARAALPEPSPQLPVHEPSPEEHPPEPTVAASESLSVAGPPAPQPTRRGFFARLFGWRSHEPAEPVQGADHPEPWDSARPGEHVPGEREQPTAEEPHPQPGPPSALEALQARYERVESAPAEALETSPAPGASPSGISAELRAAEDSGSGQEPLAEQVAAAPPDEQARAILAGVLDRLGAAHHRPFSRA